MILLLFYYIKLSALYLIPPPRSLYQLLPLRKVSYWLLWRHQQQILHWYVGEWR